MSKLTWRDVIRQIKQAQGREIPPLLQRREIGPAGVHQVVGVA